jgi:nicotinate-nucleotide adenylyltransferase
MTGIGVFGGTFDPFHVGHLIAATDARTALDLQTVLLVVAADPWQKSGDVVAGAADRLAMVEAAVAGVDGLAVDRSEVDRGGPTYTADTLSELAVRYPGQELVLIVGSDVAARLGSWRRVDEIRALASLAVLERPGSVHAEPPPGWRHRTVETSSPNVSSSDIRRRLASGRPVEGLLPAAVIGYVRANGLYRSGHTPVRPRRP